MTILARKGNDWRKLAYDEYEKERMKDGNYSTNEKSYFDKVIDYCLNASTAKLFAPAWRQISQKV